MGQQHREGTMRSKWWGGLRRARKADLLGRYERRFPGRVVRLPGALGTRNYLARGGFPPDCRAQGCLLGEKSQDSTVVPQALTLIFPGGCPTPFSPAYTTPLPSRPCPCPASSCPHSPSPKTLPLPCLVQHLLPPLHQAPPTGCRTADQRLGGQTTDGRVAGGC